MERGVAVFVTMEEVEEYVAAVLAKLSVIRLAAGTVVTSPAAMSGDELTVAMEPSALAVPVKALRGLVGPGERVVLGLVGADPRKSEWVCLGSLSEPAALAADGINSAAAADTTSSGTYVNLAGTSSFSLPKQYETTRVKVDLHANCFSTAATTSVRYAVQIGGTDYDIAQVFINPSNTHTHTSGVRYIAGIPAGTHTVQGRWRRVAGAGTLTRTAADNWLSISAEEV